MALLLRGGRVVDPSIGLDSVCDVIIEDGLIVEVGENLSIESGTVVEVEHPTRGKYLTVGNPIKMSDSPTEVTRSPLLGEHTEEVLRQLGYSANDVKTLRAEGVI